MAASQGFIVVVLLATVCFTVLGQNNQESCRDVKKKGFKVDCPIWTDPNCGAECEWFEMQSCSELDEGTCGAGMKREARARICGYMDANNRKQECQDTQDRLFKCELQCGKNGKFNELLDFCECVENWDGSCCDKKIEACTNPIVKKGETDRSIASTGKGNRCDARLRPSWYRFDSAAGNEMPDECVPQGSCNTAVPFWLNGTHPRQKDGVVERWACGTQSDQCCMHKLKIKVRNCGNFMAYYLVPTGGCNKAYCIGSHEKCPDGESSDTGFQPGCSNNFPKIEVTPTVGYTVDESQAGNNQVYLTCTAIHVEAAKYLWRTQWYFDDMPGAVQQTDPKDNNPQPKFLLPTKDWMNKMGTMATCTMQAKRRDGVGTWSQTLIKGKEYYLGVVIDQTVINVVEGDTAQITLRPNLPVRCGKKDEQIGNCDLALSLTLDPTAKGPRCPGKPKEISQVIFHGDMETRCGFREIRHNNWHMPAHLKIKPKLDIQLDGTQQRTLRMRVHENDASVPNYWKGYFLPQVTVNIMDSDDRGTCTMINDPHITTFDGRQYDFHDRPNLQGNGRVFTVYKHTVELEEVQARFTLCAGRVYCICGIAMRSGGTTVVIDKCRTSPTMHPEMNYKVQNPTKGNSMRVFKHNSGTQYHVFLATGTQVKVYNAGGNLMWFEIKASPEGRGKSIGMCGNYNKNPADDLQSATGELVCPGAVGYGWCEDEKFRNAWVVNEVDSIFAGKLIPAHKPEEEMAEMFCDCIAEPGHTGFEDCDYHKTFEPCDDGFELFNKPNGYNSGEDFPWLTNYRAPQQVNPAYKAYGEASAAHYYSSFAETNTWTHKTAKEFCHDKIFSSDAVKACLSEVPNQDYNNSIEACAQDLILTGSEEFASTHLENVKARCNQELKMNLDLWEPREEEGEDGEEKPVALVGPPLRLMENLCPNECSGQGACLDGKCTCRAEFTGYDCSQRFDAIPVVKGVVSSGNPCDRSQQECYVMAVEGMEFLEQDTLTCHYYEASGEDAPGKYFYSGPSDAPAVSSAPGTLYSLWVVQCSVPEQLTKPVSPRTTLYNLKVSISNDGKRESDRISYGSYDSACEVCGDIRGCEVKSDSCIIGSRCFKFGDLKEDNKNLACNPGVNPYDWAPASSLTTPTTPEVITSTVKITTKPVEITTKPVPTTTQDPGAAIVCTGKPDDISFHRDPTNCNKYYVCQGTIKHHVNCPAGLYFSEKQGKCLYPHEVPECTQP